MRLLEIFKNVLQIMIKVLGLYKKKLARRWEESGLHGKSENIEYLWHYDTNFLPSFTMCLEK